jgi:hypothetical protein
LRQPNSHLDRLILLAVEKGLREGENLQVPGFSDEQALEGAIQLHDRGLIGGMYGFGRRLHIGSLTSAGRLYLNRIKDGRSVASGAIMADRQLSALLVPRAVAQQKISELLERGKEFQDYKIGENPALHAWYEYVEEVLKRLFTTNEFADYFTGRGGLGLGDTWLHSYLQKLESIHDRLDLIPEQLPQVRAAAPDTASTLAHLIQRFHRVARQLRARHADRSTLSIADEYDVQDLFHALLRIFFDDIRAEEWTPSYAGGSSRMDLLLKKEQTIVEIKKTRPGLTAKAIGEQLIIDIQRYQSHPDCHSLICFVYDPEGLISNPDGLERDLSTKFNVLDVKVFIAPKDH